MNEQEATECLNNTCPCVNHEPDLIRRAAKVITDLLDASREKIRNIEKSRDRLRAGATGSAKAARIRERDLMGQIERLEVRLK